MARDGKVDLYISQVILDETTLGVMAREKFQFAQAEILKAEGIIWAITYSVEPKAGIDAVKADPTDNRIIRMRDRSGRRYNRNRRQAPTAPQELRRNSDHGRQFLPTGSINWSVQSP
jgi:hypothetical protein